MPFTPNPNFNKTPDLRSFHWAFFSLVRDIFLYYKENQVEVEMENTEVVFGYSDDNLVSLHSTNGILNLVSVELDESDTTNMIDNSLGGLHLDPKFSLPAFITIRTLENTNSDLKLSQRNQKSKLLRMIEILRKDLTEQKPQSFYSVYPNEIEYYGEIQSNLSANEYRIYNDTSKVIDFVVTEETINKTSYMTAKILFLLDYRVIFV